MENIKKVGMIMDLTSIKDWFTEENIRIFLENYRDLGPLPGLLLPFLESIFPILPIFIFIAGNAAAYGFWLGSLYSWIGSVTGALFVFVLIKKFRNIRIFRFLQTHRKFSPLIRWVEKHGFGPLFIVQCFPFSPSALINIVAGISNMRFSQYFIAVFFGKLVMVFIVSYIGHDILALFHKPVELFVILIVIILLWFGGKRMEAIFSK
jgi:uncharacterized membrane protein YdjX (TVP38/TMEM64 family)